MQRVRQQRQEQLNRYDLGSIFEDIRNRLQDIVETEREGIDDRVEEAEQRLAEPRRTAVSTRATTRVRQDSEPVRPANQVDPAKARSTSTRNAR